LKSLGNKLLRIRIKIISNLELCYLSFFCLEKATEKKHLKVEKHKGNKGMEISANITFFSWGWKEELC